MLQTMLGIKINFSTHPQEGVQETAAILPLHKLGSSKANGREKRGWDGGEGVVIFLKMFGIQNSKAQLMYVIKLIVTELQKKL